VGQRGHSKSTMEREMKIISWEHVFFVHQRIASAVKRVEFVSDRVSYIVLRGRWCNIIVLNVHAPSEEIFMRNWSRFLIISPSTI
jgi:hypothetical protein